MNTLKNRLNKYKTLAEKRGTNWRDVRSYAKPAICESFAITSGMDEGARGFSNENLPVREVVDAHTLTKLDHTGWYTDTCHSGLIVGIVCKLAHGRFLAGYRETESNTHIVYPELFDDERDAARMADEHARIVGESSHEHSQEYDNACELNQNITDKMQELCILRAVRIGHASRQHARATVSNLCADIRKLRTEFVADYSEFAGYF